MEEITIENYEAYYLDYLEGTLSKEDQMRFNQFLAENPDLVLEDDTLPVLEKEIIEMPAFEKLLLRSDVNINEITTENADFFLIASNEGILSAEDEKYLASWLAKHPSIQTSARFYKSSKLEAPTVFFAGKDKLIKKSSGRIIPLYYFSGAIAAGLLLFISVRNLNNVALPEISAPRFEMPTAAINKDSDTKGEKENKATRTKIKSNIENYVPITPENAPENQVADDLENSIKPTPKFEDNPEVKYGLANNSNGENGTQLPDNFGKTEVLTPENVPSVYAQNVAYVPFNKMNNPLAMITNSVNDRLDTDIDFRKANPKKDKVEGFYFKIGKFEISNRKHTSKK